MSEYLCLIPALLVITECPVSQATWLYQVCFLEVWDYLAPQSWYSALLLQVPLYLHVLVSHLHSGGKVWTAPSVVLVHHHELKAGDNDFFCVCGAGD